MMDEKLKKADSHLSHITDRPSELKLDQAGKPPPQLPEPSPSSNKNVNKFSILQYQPQSKQTPQKPTQQQPETPQARPRPNLNSPQIMQAEVSKESNARSSLDLQFPKPQSDSKLPQIKEKLAVNFDPDERPIAPRQAKVRISTIVQNIETQEQFNMKGSHEESFFQDANKEESSENDFESDEEKPYELTKPPALLKKSPIKEEPHINHVQSEPDIVTHVQPKIMDRRSNQSASQLSPNKSRSQSDGSPSQASSSNSYDSNDSGGADKNQVSSFPHATVKILRS